MSWITIVLENETIHHSRVMEVRGETGVDALLQAGKILALYVKDQRVRVYDPIAQFYREVGKGDQIQISRDMLAFNRLLLLKYTAPELPPQCVLECQSPKKQRSKERIISEVIKIVQRWRNIHEQSLKTGPNISLIKAARMIGLPKKSLDDYSYQLKLGRKYDFDFTAHLNDKIGVLRTFLKQYHSHKISSHSIDNISIGINDNRQYSTPICSLNGIDSSTDVLQQRLEYDDFKMLLSDSQICLDQAAQ